MARMPRVLSLLAAAALGVTGCGSSGSSSSTTTATRASSSPGALVGEAASAATGDVPDDQTFLALRSTALHFSMRYPEGWAIRRAGHEVVVRDRNNVVRVTIVEGPAPSAAAMRRALGSSARLGSLTTVSLPGGRARKVTYRTVSQ